MRYFPAVILALLVGSAQCLAQNRQVDATQVIGAWTVQQVRGFDTTEPDVAYGTSSAVPARFGSTRVVLAIGCYSSGPKVVFDFGQYVEPEHIASVRLIQKDGKTARLGLISIDDATWASIRHAFRI